MKLHPQLAFARQCRFIPVPPPERIHVGSSAEAHFRDVGCRTSQRLIDHAGLTQSSKVLDLGCGIGRTALALTQFLTEGGEYDGLDVALDGLEWCREKIAPLYPNFRFHHADLHNEYYAGASVGHAASYRLPFEDNRFDVVFLASVFTHMVPEETQNYLKEIARVLTPQGKLWATWFMVDRGVGAEVLNRPLLDGGGNRIPINWADGKGHYFTDSNRGTNAVGYDEEIVDAMHEAAALRILTKVRGTWCGRPQSDTAQDFIVAERA